MHMEVTICPNTVGVSPDGRNVLGVDVVNGCIVRLSYPGSQRIPVCSPPDDILPEISHQPTANTNKSWSSLVNTKLLCAHFRAVWTLLRKSIWMVQLLVIASHSLKWQIFHTLKWKINNGLFLNSLSIRPALHIIKIWHLWLSTRARKWIFYSFYIWPFRHHFPTWVQPLKSKN